MATKRKEPESQRISWFLYSFELPLLCIMIQHQKVAQRILQTYNERPDIHERFMEMCGKVAGRWRTILGSSPEEMDVPIKVDEELYFEGKFDTEAMLNMLEKKVLEPAGVDYSSIKIRYMGKGQEAAKSVEPVPEQDALEHEEQEQHAPVQTM